MVVFVLLIIYQNHWFRFYGFANVFYVIVTES